MRRLTLTAVFVAFAGFAALAVRPARAALPTTTPGSPLAELKKSNAQLDKILGKRAADWTPEGDLQRAEVRKLVGSFLDFEELARRALSRHWDPLKKTEREDFVTTLRELVERSYLRQVHGAGAYQIKYDRESKAGEDATVTAQLHTTSRGKKIVMDLEYKLLLKDNRWLVYDVITDEQSLLENYRAEFNKIITKESFEALLKRMKRKLEEKEKAKDGK